MKVTKFELYVAQNFRIERKMLRKCLTDLGRSEEDFCAEIIEKYSIPKDRGFDINNKTREITILAVGEKNISNVVSDIKNSWEDLYSKGG